MSDWEIDCDRFYGKTLTGRFKHWCDEWDYLPIDDTCTEMVFCNCFTDLEFLKRKAELAAAYEKEQLENVSAS